MCVVDGREAKVNALTRTARENAEEIQVFVDKYRRDPENYLTTHEALDEDQAEADSWRAAANTIQYLRAELAAAREENKRLRDASWGLVKEFRGYYFHADDSELAAVNRVRELLEIRPQLPKAEEVDLQALEAENGVDALTHPAREEK